MAPRRKPARRRARIFVGDIQIGAEAQRLVAGVLRSGRLTSGPHARGFESEVARLHRCSSGIFCSSGSAAIHLALAALAEIDGWKLGDEIIVPSLTFIATLNIVSMMGFKPVLARVDPGTFNIDPADVERRITPRTRCILPVHVLGLPAGMESLTAIASRHRLRIVEDSCEAMFCGIGGRPVGSFGDAGCFSFAVGHVISTGLGGMLVTKNDQLAAIARSLLNHGRDLESGARFRFVRRGFSYRTTDMEAALGLADLKSWRAALKRRARIATRYREVLASFSELVRTQSIPDGFTHSNMAFAVVCRTPELRRDLESALESAGIETRPLYPVVTQPIVARRGIEQDFPEAAHLGSAGLFFGCHPGLSDADVDHLGESLQAFFSSR